MLEKRGHYPGVPRVASKLQSWDSNPVLRQKLSTFPLHHETPPLVCRIIFHGLRQGMQEGFLMVGGSRDAAS